MEISPLEPLDPVTRQALQSSAFDHSPHALVCIDAHARLIASNDAARALFGEPLTSGVGQALAELLLAPDSRPLLAGALVACAADPSCRGPRLRLDGRGADGAELPLDVALWRTAVGSRQFFTLSLADLTPMETARMELERQREAIRQGEKLSMMGSLLAGVAHELNNPLAIAMGRASLLEEKCEDDALRGDVRRIREAADRCGRIVRTFLNMARQRPAQRARVELAAIATGAADMLLYSFRARGIELERDLHPALPAITADGDQLSQIVVNLLVNAQQAVADTLPPRRVTLRTGAGPDSGTVWLEVEDTGPGVPAALRGRIFDAFMTTKPAGVGTGLGLSLSRAIAQAHDGRLDLIDPPPDAPDGPLGAVFRLTLPVDTCDAAPAAAPEGRRTQQTGHRGRLLVIDPEVEMGALMGELLESGGYLVRVAPSAVAALAFIHAETFDGIVADVGITDMDCLELVWRLEAVEPDARRRLLFLTGDTLSRDTQVFLADAGVPVLEKPFTNLALLGAVRALTAGQ